MERQEHVELEAAAPVETQVGPVTLAEVRAVVENPFETNANKVRDALGRGSNATIQKHLQTLRKELQKEKEVLESDAPEAPESVISNLWITAWNAATAQVRGRIEGVTAERDAYRETAEAATADAKALADALDETRAEKENQIREREMEQQAAADALAQAQTQAETKIQAILEQLVQAQAGAEQQAQADAAKIKELQHAAQLVERDREIERRTLQTEIDRLTGQLSQVQALLWKERERPELKPESAKK